VHFYPHANAAIVRVEGSTVAVGDTVRFLGHTTDFQQRVERIELEHDTLAAAVPGQTVGIQVAKRVREHDRVVKVLVPEAGVGAS
jgi:putative protease